MAAIETYQESAAAPSQAVANDAACEDVTQSQQIFQSSRAKVKTLVWVVKLLLFGSVLACLVLSKITLIKIFAELHLLSNFSNSNFSHPGYSQEQDASNLYWMLFFIVLVPNIVSWFRSLLSGLLSKSPHRPWPKCSAIFGCLLNASLEAIAESFLIFYAFITLPPAVSLLLMCGVYSTQSLFETFASAYHLYKRGRNNYVPIEISNSLYRVGRCRHCLVVFMMFIGLFCQGAGLCSVTIFLVIAYNEGDRSRIMGSVLAVPCLVVLSLAWSGLLQKSTYLPSQHSIDNANKQSKHCGNDVTARWKASFIATSVRLLIYPIASYCIFRFLYKLHNCLEVDPWAISPNSLITITDAFQWSHFHITVFALHISTSFLAYVLSWIACYMTLHVSGLALPMIFATPISLIIYFTSNSSFQVNGNVFILFPFERVDASLLDWKNTLLSPWYIGAFVFGFLLWIGQLLVSSFNLFKAKNAILASDENMFVRPYYNSVLLEQSLAINRDVSHKPQVQMDGRREPCEVFVCSTMFRENTTEMRQMLHSIKRIAKLFQKESEKGDGQVDQYESHIFFDGGCREDELSSFAIQLMSLLPEALGVSVKHVTRQETPYGYRLSWFLNNCMPFMIHLKDNLKVRNKKRWSQVMYMNYILEYRSKEEVRNLDNTFILTTDADIDFKAESAVVLLDMLARDPQVGAVCSRTHPLGNGPLYWYQIFDYAIGHWLQKSTEHILGSVLCCPGCFSMFRCSALKDCLPTYSGEVSDAMEFLTMDMGEDRWLCTLLVENGWRLEYCAISNDYTYCPVSFDEFYKQRRRWIPSTVANLWLLVSKAGKITAKNESISWGFIIYQIIVIISTIISPATVILVIASGLSASFGLNSVAVVVVLVIFAIFYGIVCVYTSQKTQLDTAKFFTFIFSVVMAVVVVGIIKETVENILFPFKVNQTSTESEDALQTSNVVKLPIADTTVYIILFTFVFIITALLHFIEGLALFHCLWYLLGLPSGYLLLLIYSTANLNNRRWGTRDDEDKSQKNLFIIFQQSVMELILKCGLKIKQSSKKPDDDKDDDPLVQQEIITESPMGLEEPENEIPRQKYTHPWLISWLNTNRSYHFYDNFVKEGYTEEWFLSAMARHDLKEIGVRPSGYLHHLEKAINKLPHTPIQAGLPKCVEDWIVYLKLDTAEDQYIEKFHMAGYYGEDDVENLVHITKDELKNEIGVKKKAHVKRFMEGIRKLKIRSEDEERVVEVKVLLQATNDEPGGPLKDSEIAFWSHLAEFVLKPTPDGLTQANELRSDLNFLRNYTLIAMLLINLIWLILLSVFTFSELKAFGLSASFLGLLFLAVYGILISVQFVGMLIHRVVTLSHYIARLNQDLPIENSIIVTVRE